MRLGDSCLLQPEYSLGDFLRELTPMRLARITGSRKTLLRHQHIARGHSRETHPLLMRQIEIPKFRCEGRCHRLDANASISPLGTVGVVTLIESRIEQPALPN